MIIEFKDVTKTFQLEEKARFDVALQHVSFEIEQGEFVCIIGPSGEGKSTILKLISGLILPTEGTITKPATVSMAFQSGALFPWLSIFDNVALGLRATHTPQHIIQEESMKYIDMMRLGEFIDKRPSDLSGGQRQRVGIARALAVNPHVLLLDEPFSALDPKTTAELHDDVLKIWRDTGKTIVMVSHLIEEAVSLAQRIILIKEYTVADTFPVALPYPRREQATEFMHEVTKIRKEFFK